MTEQNFIHAVNQIAAFLRSKEVPNHTKMAWYDKVNNIPDETLPYIVARITDEADVMPRNLPKAFRESFRLWQMENTSKTIEAKERGCRDCEEGILFLERDGVTATVFCRCYSGSAGRVGRSSLYEMEAAGWTSTKLKKVGAGGQHFAELRDQLSRARNDDRNPDEKRMGPSWGGR